MKLGPAGFDKIAILGSAPSSTLLAPFDNPEWAVWCTSPSVFSTCGAKRTDVWFELHRWLPYKPGQFNSPGTRPWFSPEFHQFLKDYKGTVFMTEQQPDIPNCVQFPYKQLIDKYGPYFFQSSISWMLAYAIEQMPKSIGLFGIDMAAGEEWCVAPETRVLMADLRWVPAGELVEGDQIVAFDENAGGDNNYRSWKLATVEKTQRLRRPCKRLHMEDGTKLVSSDEHRWLVHAENDNRWKQTDQMVSNMHREGRPTRIVKLLDMWEENKSWEAGYLAAAFDGEGHLHQGDRSECNGTQNVLGFAQRENAMSQTVIDACKSLGFDLRTTGFIGGMNGDCIKYRLAGGRGEIMKFLGSIRPRRLMSKFRPDMLGVVHKKETVAVMSMEDIGEQEVIGLKTSTGTFVAEGFASHNSYQRPSCQHWVGLAKAAGIEVILPPESDLMRHSTLYGIGEHNQRHVKLRERLNELEANRNVIQGRVGQDTVALHQINGAIDQIKYVLELWSDDIQGDMEQAMSFSGVFVKSEPMKTETVAAVTETIAPVVETITHPVADMNNQPPAILTTTPPKKKRGRPSMKGNGSAHA